MTRSSILDAVVTEHESRVHCAIGNKRSIHSRKALNRGIEKHYLNIFTHFYARLPHYPNNPSGIDKTGELSPSTTDIYSSAQGSS